MTPPLPKEFHPVANIFPLMDGDEFEALKADVLANGLKDPIVLHEERVVDGRNRLRACVAVGITPVFTLWDRRGSLIAFVMSLNLHRRHLSASQKAAIAAEVEPMLAKEAGELQRASLKRGAEPPVAKPPPSQAQEKPPIPTNAPVVAIVPHRQSPPAPTKAREQAARATGASPRYVQDAKTVLEKDPAIFEKVKSGEITLPQASRAVARAEKIRVLDEKAAAAPRPSDDAWRVIHGPCTVELYKMQKGAARLIFADPPYNIGRDYHGQGAEADLLPEDMYLSWCERWMAACVDVLADDGSMWVMISDEYADHFGLLLRKVGLHRRSWVVWYETFGVNCANNFNRCSRHIFYCVKDPRRFVFNADAVSRPSDRQTKYNDARADPGGKIWDSVWPIPRLVGTSAEKVPGFDNQLPLALVRPIVLCASDPGDLVLDPFNGTGTTGVAAVTTGRRYVGIEANAGAVEVARKRILVTPPYAPTVTPPTPVTAG